MQREIGAFLSNSLGSGASGLLVLKAKLRIPRKRTGILEHPWQRRLSLIGAVLKNNAAFAWSPSWGPEL